MPARYMATAFDAADPLAGYRLGLGLAAEAELSDLVEALRLCAARAARTARGPPCRVTPSPAPAPAPTGGNAGRKAPWRSSRHLAERSDAHDNAPARDSSPSWAQVTDALKPRAAAAAAATARAPDWAHAPRARRGSKDHLKRDARATGRVRARGGGGRPRGLRA